MSDYNEQQYVWRREGEAFNPKNTIPTANHGAGSDTLCGCFTASGFAALKKVNGIVKKEDYLQIHQENLKSSAEDWFLCAAGCEKGTMNPNTHQK